MRFSKTIDSRSWIVGDTNGAGWIHVPRCPADLANDQGVTCPNGRVNVFDLFVLLGNWNTSGLGADLASPTNVVDVFDLFVLLSSWTGNEETTCPNAVGTAQSLEDEVTGAGLTMNDWDEFQDVMTDTESQEKTKANYNCWMMNYLSGCTTCPPCPDDDPYE